MKRYWWLLLIVLLLVVSGLWLFSQHYALMSGRTVMTRTMYQHIAERLNGESEEAIFTSASNRLKMLELARQEGLFDDPEIDYAIDDLIILKLRQRLSNVKNDSPPEAELRKYFQQNPDKYITPEQRRVALIRRVKDEANKDDEFKEALAAFKVELDQQFNPGHGFGQLAGRYSTHKRSRLRGGDMGWLSKDAQRDLPPAVAKALWEIPSVKGLSIIDLEDSTWYVLLSDLREVKVPEYTRVAKRVLYDYFLEKRSENEEQWQEQWSVLPSYRIPEL